MPAVGVKVGAAVVILAPQHPTAAHIDKVLQILVVPGCRADGVDGRRHIGRQQQNVAPSHQRRQRLVPARVVFRHTLHVQPVGNHQPLEVKLLPQQVADHVARQRRRVVALLLIGVHLQMSRHHPFHTRVYQLAERVEVHRVHIFPRVVDHRQVEMAVGLSVAVARKMLGHSHHPLALQPFHILNAQRGHTLRVVAERPRTDDGVPRIAVDVHHWGEIHMYAHIAALQPDLAPHVVQQGVHLRRQRPPRPILRKRVAVLQPHPQSPLGVDAHQQRHLAQRLEPLHEGQCLLGRPHKETHAAHLRLPQQLLEIALPLPLQVQRHTYHHQLRHLLPQRHVAHRSVHPRRRHPWRAPFGRSRRTLYRPRRTFHSTHLTLAHHRAQQHCNTQYYKLFTHDRPNRYFLQKYTNFL